MLPDMRLDSADRLERLLDMPVAGALGRIRLEPNEESIQDLQRPRRLTLGKREAAADRLMPVRVCHVSAGFFRCRCLASRMVSKSSWSQWRIRRSLMQLDRIRARRNQHERQRVRQPVRERRWPQIAA